MAAENYSDFTLQKNAYAAFDAVTLKNLLIERLKNSNFFTDQVFEGSNLSSITDIVAFSYHTLLFYLNNQSAEASFSQVQLYENMNKLVSLINYNPLGSQTSLLSIEATARAALAVGNYTIRRFSFLAVNGVFYSFPNDIYFEKSNSEIEVIDSIGRQNLMYQGQFKEYPTQTALGDEFEVITLINDNLLDNTDTTFIDHNSIFVYVKDFDTEVWSEWTEAPNLFMRDATDTVFEKRFNENGRFQLKFGDDISGKKLKEGDLVAIYYLQSDGSKGVVSSNLLSNQTLSIYTTPRFREIVADVYSDSSTLISQSDLTNLLFNATNSSTEPKLLESVTEIRNNAPKLFSAQNRAVIASDYDVLIRKNFSNIVIDVHVANNNKYQDYIAYFYSIGLNRPNDDSRVLLNQVNFYNTCDFNNIYCFVVPKNFLTNEISPQVLNPSLKQLIVNQLEPYKMENVDVIPSDPIFIAADVAVLDVNESPEQSFTDQSYILVERLDNNRINKVHLKSEIYDKIVEFFAEDNNALGQTLDFTRLSRDLLSIEGVKTIKTVRTKSDGTSIDTNGVSFVLWNPTYAEEDIQITSQNTTLPFFKFPFLYNKSKFIDKIIIQ